MNNIYVLNKNYKKIGTLSNQGVNPHAPYYNDLYTQDLETGADTYQFSTVSTQFTQDCIEVGNHIMFSYKNRNELFTITSLEYSHNEGYKTVGVYAESVGFELLDVYMKRPKKSSNDSSDDEDGRDNDDDGDDNYDDEYADVDDVYLDENGIIIYDEKGGTKPNEEDVYVDENGIIIYKPKNNKKYKDRPSDSLEFKNISYPRFLSIVLKKTGWNYICQPGLENNKQDMRISYDTNIFAILQDSMQSYKGVELEFVYEYNNGKVQKTIKAYNDGGRGSFVGKRFEYGTNVKGITKTQKVANNEDDTVLFIDNIGIEVYYDVDFALKSAEVPEIEIGDTHYVIDREFHPPLEIKARIGKIEISFTDSTKNKIYLANNKKIRGSALENEYEDYTDDYDGGEVSDHDHDRLVSWTIKEVEHENGGHGTAKMQNRVELIDQALVPLKPYKYFMGTAEKPWLWLVADYVYSYNHINSVRYGGYCYHVRYNREEMEDVKQITNSSEVTKQDLLNFIMNDLKVYEYSATKNNEATNKYVDDPEAYFPKQTYFGLLSEDVHNSDGRTSKVGNRISKGRVEGDTDNDGDVNVDDKHFAYDYNIPALLTCLIGAFQQHVLTGGGATTTGPSDKDQDIGYIPDSNPGNNNDDPGYTPPDPSDPDDPGTDPDNPSNPDDPGTDPDNPSDPSNPSTGNVFDTITVRKIQGPDPGEGQYNRVEFEGGIRVDYIWCAHPDTGAIHMQDELVLHNGLELYGDLDVDGNIYAHNFPSSDISLKENIRYIDAASTTDDLEKTDLYDFIVNQVNLCEYNFIGDTADKIGFIANEYEGTKVGDKIVARNKKTDLLVYDISNLLFATIGALQEEVRIKDEKIASLEARLARIEALLDINND